MLRPVQAGPEGLAPGAATVAVDGVDRGRPFSGLRSRLSNSPAKASSPILRRNEMWSSAPSMRRLRLQATTSGGSSPSPGISAWTSLAMGACLCGGLEGRGKSEVSGDTPSRKKLTNRVFWKNLGILRTNHGRHVIDEKPRERGLRGTILLLKPGQD